MNRLSLVAVFICTVTLYYLLKMPYLSWREEFPVGDSLQLDTENQIGFDGRHKLDAMNSTLVRVGGKPDWMQTAPLGDDLSLETEDLDAKRDLITKNFDLHRFHVLWGSNPHDLEPPPKGWAEAQKQKLRETQFSQLPPEQIEEIVGIFTFEYHPVRVFVVPRSDTEEIVRFFKVGTHNQDSDAVMQSAAERLGRIDRVTPISVVHADCAALQFKFLEKSSIATCREIQKLFPFEEEGDIRLGVEGYLEDWTPETDPWFLADRFYRDQSIQLWWD